MKINPMNASIVGLIEIKESQLDKAQSPLLSPSLYMLHNVQLYPIMPIIPYVLRSTYDQSFQQILGVLIFSLRTGNPPGWANIGYTPEDFTFGLSS